MVLCFMAKGFLEPFSVAHWKKQGWALHKLRGKSAGDLGEHCLSRMLPAKCTLGRFRLTN